MDFATIIGLILGFVAVVVGMVVKGADVTALLNPAAKINYFYRYICRSMYCISDESTKKGSKTI